MTGATVVRRSFGRIPGGEETHVYELRLANGSSALITDFGAALVGLRCPDRDGVFADVVLAGDDGPAPASQAAYFGSVVGRVAGRVAHARMSFGNQTLVLTSNHGAHHMHGGHIGLSARPWHAEESSGPDPSVRFSVTSPDGEEGYPGNLEVSATWTLWPPCRLSVRIEAVCDASTPFNPTLHPYFNLDGHASGTLAHHRLAIEASRYTPVGPDCLPSGTIDNVAGTLLDFRTPRPVLGDIQPGIAGIDHNFVRDNKSGSVAPAAHLESTRTGRKLTVWTDRPCLHLYTGGNLGGVPGKNGSHYSAHAGLCLEPQGFPDMFAHAAFPKQWLAPGSRFTSVTIYDFGVRQARALDH